MSILITNCRLQKSLSLALPTRFNHSFERHLVSEEPENISTVVQLHERGNNIVRFDIAFGSCYFRVLQTLGHGGSREFHPFFSCFLVTGRVCSWLSYHLGFQLNQLLCNQEFLVTLESCKKYLWLQGSGPTKDLLLFTRK